MILTIVILMMAWQVAMAMEAKRTYIPTFTGDESDFTFWWMRFRSYACVAGFAMAIGRVADKNLPSDDSSPLTDDEEIKARKANFYAVSALTLAFQTESLMDLVRNARTTAWPNGLAWKVVDALFNRYRPNDTMSIVEMKRELRAIQIRNDEDPQRLFDLITRIEHRYGDTLAMSYEEKLAKVLEVAPKVYLAVLTAEIRALKRAGVAVTLDALRMAMRDQWRIEYPGGNKKNATTETELDLTDQDEDDDAKEKRPHANKTCDKCGKKGHIAHNCWLDPKQATKVPAWFAKKHEEKKKEEGKEQAEHDKEAEPQLNNFDKSNFEYELMLLSIAAAEHAEEDQKDADDGSGDKQLQEEEVAILEDPGRRDPPGTASHDRKDSLRKDPPGKRLQDQMNKNDEWDKDTKEQEAVAGEYRKKRTEERDETVAGIKHMTGEYRKKRTEERDETVAGVNNMTGEYRKKRTEERDETVAGVNHMAGEYRKKRTEERDETVADKYRARQKGKDPRQVNAEQYCPIILLDMIIRAVAVCYTLLGIIHDMIIWAVAGWYALLCIIHGIKHAAIRENACVKEQVLIENEKYKKVSDSSNEGEMKNYVGGEMKYDRKERLSVTMKEKKTLYQSRERENKHKKQRSRSVLLNLVRDCSRYKSEVTKSHIKSIKRLKQHAEMAVTQRTKPKHNVRWDGSFDFKFEYDEWNGTRGLKVKIPMQKTSDNREAQELCHNWFRGGKTSPTEDNQSFVKESKEIDAARKLGTVQQRKIERHAQ